MLKTIFLLITATILISCKSDQKTVNKTDTVKTTTKETKAKDIKTDSKAETESTGDVFNENNYGSYVDDMYKDRANGADWVSVTFLPLANRHVMVSVRSRADKMQPTCTMDGIAYPSDSNSLSLASELGVMKFVFANNTVSISAGDNSEAALMTYNCRGGASLKGVYTKISGELDPKQVDKRSYVKTLSLVGSDIMFFVEAAGDKLTIQPQGLKIDNRVINETIDGMVVNSEIADINGDGSPEIFIYTTSAGSGSYGKVFGYSVNNGKSVTPIYMPDIMNNKEASEGYMGHDKFAVVEESLIRRFPYYKPGDTNANPTGGMKQIQYKLQKGEATWQLVIDKIITY